MPQPPKKLTRTEGVKNVSGAKAVFAMGKAPKKSGKGKAKTAKATQKGGKKTRKGMKRSTRKRMTRRRR